MIPSYVMLVSASGKTDQQNLIFEKMKITSEWGSSLQGTRPDLLGNFKQKVLGDA